MTTIVYNPEEGVVAADSQDTDGSRKMQCDKLYYVNEHIIGTAGGSYAGLLFVRWFGEWEDEPDYTDWEQHPDLVNLDLDEDFECLVVRPDGTCYMINRLFIPYEMKPGPVGVGSGSACALGALMAGAHVKQAVKIACTIDAHTSGPVKTMRVLG